MQMHPIPAPFKNRMSMSLTGGGGIRPAFYMPLTQGMNVAAGDMTTGTMTRDSDFTYIDASGVLQYGYGSRTNLWVDSDPSSATGFTATEVTFESYAWGVEGLDNATVFGDNSVERYCYYRPTFTEGVDYLLSFYIEMEDFAEPVYNTDFNVRIYGLNPGANNRELVYIAPGIYRFWAWQTATGTGVENIGVQKTVGDSSKGFKVSGFQVEELPSDNALGPELVSQASNISHGAEWTTDTTNQEFDCDGSQGSNTYVTHSDVLQEPIGKYYSVEWTVSNISAGAVTVQFGGVECGFKDSVGTYSQIVGPIASDADQSFYVKGNQDFAGSVEYDTLALYEIPAWVVEHSKLGPELVVNGTFDENIDGWTLPATPKASIEWDSSGSLKMTRTSEEAMWSYALQTPAANTFTIGNYYYYTLDYKVLSVGSGTVVNVYAALWNDGSEYASATSLVVNDAGTISLIFQAADDNPEIRLAIYESGFLGHEVLFDNVSVKEILDPAIQPGYYTETTDSTELIPVDVPIEADGLAFMGSTAVNLLPYSEDFSEWENWGSYITLEASEFLAPDGRSKAYSLTDTGNNVYDRLQTSVFTGSGHLNYSVFFKAGSSDDFTLFLIDLDNSNVLLNVDFVVTNGVPSVDAEVIGTGYVIPLSDGWYRVYGVTGVEAVSGTGINVMLTSTNHGGSSDPESVNYWGAQLTNGSQLYSYIPTRGVPAAVMPTENVRWTMTDKLKGILGDTTAATAAGVDAGEGTVILEWTPGYWDDAWDGGIISSRNTQYISFMYKSNADIVAYDGANATNINPATNPDPGDNVKMAVRFTKTGSAMQAGYYDGSWLWDSEETFDGAFVTDDYLTVGISTIYNFHIKNIRVFDRALSTAEIERIA